MHALRPTAETPFEAAILARTQELVPYGMLTTDRELRITSWNAWLECHSGIRAEEAIGRPLLELFHGLVSRRLDEPFNRALKGEVAVLSAVFHRYLFPFPNTFRTSDAPHMLQTARIAPLLNAGEICGTITVVEDVTQREHDSAALRQQELRNGLLARALQQLMEAADPKTVLAEVFARLALHLKAEVYILHLLEENSVRLHASAGLSEAERDLLPATWDPDQGKDPNAPCATHESAPLDLSALGLQTEWQNPLQMADRVLGLVVFGRRDAERFDATELEFAQVVCRYVTVALDRSLAEQQLRHAHAELERRVEERTARLQESIAQLESFSYTLAHDLRAPLRTMRGYAEVLLEDGGNTFSSTQRQYLAKIRVAATGMELLTRDLLDFSKISRDRLELTSVDLEEMLREIVMLTPALQTAGVLTVASPLPAVSAQQTLLQQSLSNLLSNALKFIPPGAEPRVTVRAELRGRDAANVGSHAQPAFQPAALEAERMTLAASSEIVVRLWVEDNGIGIAPENHRKVFGVFERLHSREGYDGTGVGLAIVARSIHRMGGACGVESELGQGSRFWIELPKAP